MRREKRLREFDWIDGEMGWRVHPRQPMGGFGAGWDSTDWIKYFDCRFVAHSYFRLIFTGVGSDGFYSMCQVYWIRLSKRFKPHKNLTFSFFISSIFVFLCFFVLAVAKIWNTIGKRRIPSHLNPHSWRPCIMKKRNSKSRRHLPWFYIYNSWRQGQIRGECNQYQRDDL